MTWRMRTACVLVILSIMAPIATADELIDVHLNDKVLPGQQPSLEVRVFHRLESMTLELKRNDGKTIRQKRKRPAAGSNQVFKLPQPPGQFRYRGELKVTLTSGEQARMPLDFATVTMQSMGLAVSRSDLNVAEHNLMLHANRLVFSVDYSITGEDGETLGRGTVTPKDAGNRVLLTWKQKPGKVLKIDLLAKDADDFTEKLTLFPWRWAIPHEEVVFESGRWNIAIQERSKLDHSFKLLRQGLAKYGKLIPVRLYIAGYTDTVADAQYNQRLSEQRARSIAAYFREKGFNRPIFFQGFGERALKVATPDDTDEPQNRRAEYVLAAEPPPVDTPNADDGWKRLK